MKKTLSILLIVAMLLSTVLVGCSKAENSSSNGNTTSGKSAVNANINLQGYPIVKNKITVKMMGAKHPIHGNWSDMVFFKEMEKLTNINFKFDTPAWDAFEEKKNLAFSSGDLPDVFFGGLLTKQQEVKYGSQGILIPLEDYINKYCPNIQDMFSKNPNVKKSVTAPDGHIYALPNITTAPLAMTSAMWMNKKWLDKFGITDNQLPTNVDDLYKLFIKMKNEDPNGNGKKDEIPYSMNDKGEGFYYFLPAFGPYSRGIYADKSGKIKYGFMEDNTKEFLKWCNKLWKEGLVDPDAFTQQYNDMAAKGSDNLIGAAVHAIPQLIYGVTDPQVAATYPALPAQSSSVNPTQQVARSSGITTGTFAVTNKCKNVIEMMRWVDYLYSKEGSLLIHYGPEGNLWKYNDKKMRVYIQPTDGRNVEEKRGGEITPDCGLPLPKWVRPDTETSWDDAQQQTRAKQTDEKLWPYAVLPLPDIYFTVEEQDQVDVLNTDIEKYISENGAKFITGDTPIENFDEFRNTLKKMGIEKLIGLYQTAYDRWKK